MKQNKELFLTILISFVIASCITILKLVTKNFYLKTYIIPFTFLLVGFLILIFYLKIKKNKKSWNLLIFLSLILLSNFIIKIDWSNQILNVLLLPFLINMFFLKVVNEKQEINRYFWKGIFKLFPKNLTLNIKELSNIKKREQKINTSKIMNICIGCIIGIPIALLIIGLLTSADQYFHSFINTIFNFLNSSKKWDSILTNLFTLLMYFIVIFSIYQNAIKSSLENKTEEMVTKEINKTIIKTILIIINSVFILFLISEISKLTYNFLKLPTEYTYASFAREGFFQLLFVTLINFIVIIYLVYYTNALKNNKDIHKLLISLILFSIILIFNSYYRMFLYMYEYGFTILRLQVILFLFMELLLFIILIKKIWTKLKNKDSTLFTSIILTTYIINLYFCTEPVIDLLNKIILK